MATNRFWLLLFSLAATMILAGGCEKPERITKYTVDKPPVEEPTARDRRSGPAGRRTDRSHCGRHRAAGPTGLVLQIDRSQGRRASRGPTTSLPWLSPCGFRPRASPSGVCRRAGLSKTARRSASPRLSFPPSPAKNDKPLEISVTVLPKSGDDADYVLVNVNRWRNQLKLPPIAKEQLAGESTNSIWMEPRPRWSTCWESRRQTAWAARRSCPEHPMATDTLDTLTHSRSRRNARGQPGAIALGQLQAGQAADAAGLAAADRGAVRDGDLPDLCRHAGAGRQRYLGSDDPILPHDICLDRLAGIFPALVLRRQRRPCPADSGFPADG